MARLGTSGLKSNMRAGNDISLKISGDPNFDKEEMELQTEINVLKQQIAMILYTRKHDVLGVPMLGANLEDLIYSLRSTEGLNLLSCSKYKHFVLRQINTLLRLV